MAAASMILIRAATAASLPPPEDAARLLAAAREGAAAPAQTAPRDAPRTDTRHQIESAPAAVVEEFPRPAAPRARGPASFDALLAELEARRDIDLQLDLETYMRVARFEPGHIVYALDPKAPNDIANRLKAALDDMGAGIWRLERVAAAESETTAERHKRERREALDDIAKHPFVQEALQAFPGARVVEVRAADDTPIDPEADNVVPLQPARRRGGAKE
jgi:DNA polymerase-3 subunit gamma/tau